MDRMETTKWVSITRQKNKIRLAELEDKALIMYRNNNQYLR